MSINRWIICTVEVADGGEDVKLDMVNESPNVVKICQWRFFPPDCKVNFTPNLKRDFLVQLEGNH